MQTEHIAGPVWRVKSESANKYYNVDLSVPNCTCTDWVTKRNRLVGQGKPDFYQCKHILAAIDAQTDEQRAEQSHDAVDAKAEEIMNRFRRNETEEKVEEIKARFRK